MQSIQVGKLKSEFSEILRRVHDQGETIIIEYGKKHEKIAMLVPYRDASINRRFGPLKNKGSFKFSDDFSMAEEELLQS